MTLVALLIAVGLLGASGVPPLMASRGSRLAELLSAAMMVTGGLVGSVCACLGLAGAEAELVAEWFLPWGRVWLHMDPLGAAFLVPVFVVPALGAVYSVAYWPGADAPAARSLRVFYGLLAGAMALVVLAKDGVFFLMVWEVMALAAFFAVAAEDSKPEVRRAAWVYFVATHLGTLALIAMFALARVASGGFALTPFVPGTVGAPMASGIFVLALVGFGVKAGIAPLHVWLPGAHANAPSHVSAVLSGVMLKMGVYGVVRVCSLLPEVAPWWGWLLVGLGVASALFGITLAIAQSDYKRLLAYSSIENIGIIMLGFGGALLGRALHDPVLTALAIAGSLLHVWNHALFKPLLFFAAGSVLHATGTRQMGRLGGLARAMPWTAALAGVGCVAIGALPPLNGFVSEWLIYQGLLGRVGEEGSGGVLDAAFAGAVAVLALVGALATVAFVRLFGVVFLGTRRSEPNRPEHESPPAMLAPACLLALACIAIGTLPFVVVPWLAEAVRIAAGGLADGELRSAAPGSLGTIGALSTGVLATGTLATWGIRRLGRAHAAPRADTWDCGFARPSARMQYGESSLGQMVVGLFAWIVSPRSCGPRVRGPFPAPASHRTEIPDVVLDRAVMPGLGLITRLLLRLRLLQQGRVQAYVLYILLAVLLLLILVRPPAAGSTGALPHEVGSR